MNTFRVYPFLVVLTHILFTLLTVYVTIAIFLHINIIQNLLLASYLLGAFLTTQSTDPKLKSRFNLGRLKTFPNRQLKTLLIEYYLWPLRVAAILLVLIKLGK